MENPPETPTTKPWLHIWTIELLLTMAIWAISGPWMSTVLFSFPDWALVIWFNAHHLLPLLPWVFLITGIYLSGARKDPRQFAIGFGLAAIQLVLVLVTPWVTLTP